MPAELPILPFPSPATFRAWLLKHHATHPDGIWIRFYKKGSGKKTITYAEALDEALCFGWIDSQLKTLDETSYKQRFSPRRARSIWSTRNIEHVKRLIKEKRMMPAGLAQVKAAKADGRHALAYDPPSKASIPKDLQAIIDADPKMKKFVATLNRSNIYAIFFRLTTAKKPETRDKRLKAIVAMLKAGKKFHETRRQL